METTENILRKQADRGLSFNFMNFSEFFRSTEAVVDKKVTETKDEEA